MAIKQYRISLFYHAIWP